ncbi:MAG: Hpt domain-containing protein [Proteobacteria bacterium]|jgi:HPt (histidine-containing phosphotransfer) domain-containing protein|nr:Hpt domain-containing protein [Pseudomonadota bacterium]
MNNALSRNSSTMTTKKTARTQAEIQASLADLQARYAASLPEKIRQLQAFWQAVCADPENPVPRESLELASHKLAGSGSSYGFPYVTRLARQIEERIRASHGQPLSAQGRNDIDRLLRALAETVDHPEN